jgi:hypothetical protein
MRSRQAAATQADPAWLAYTAYGDPLAALERVP